MADQVVDQMLPENKHEDEWMIMKDHEDDDDDDIYNNASSFDDNSTASSSSDLVDDDASSPTSTLLNSSSNSLSDGPLFQLSDLMSHLPIKKGLSKYYEGKSQSFTSLSRVISIEDLPKKESYCYNNRRKMKTSKSYGNGLLDAHKPYTLPKPIISKKVSRRSLSFSNSALNSSRPPPPILKKF